MVIAPVIVALVAVNAPACVIVTVGLPVGPAENAVAPLDRVVVFPAFVALRLVVPIVHPQTVPVSNTHDFPAMLKVDILAADMLFACIMFDVMLFATISSAIIWSGLGHPNIFMDALLVTSGFILHMAIIIPPAITTFPGVVVACIEVGESGCQ